MNEITLSKILYALEDIAKSQRGQLESQLRVEEDTRDTNERLLSIAEANGRLLAKNQTQMSEDREAFNGLD